MKTLQIATFAVSFLSLAACGTEEEPPVSDAAADVGDVGGDTGSPGCVGPDPSETCLDTGCPGGQVCVASETASCVPSVCTCSDGSWECTADCGQGYVCAPEPDACPSTEPDYGTACSEPETLTCAYETECCCGDCYAAIECACLDGAWQCAATDACSIESCAGRACETDTDCEGGAYALDCVDGVCVRDTPAAGWTAGTELTLGACADGGRDDAYFTDGISIDGDTLTLELSYSGGCETHQFRACWDGSFAESWPVQTTIRVQHDSADDPCEAIEERTLTVDLTPIREAYQEGYRTEEGTVTTHVAGETVSYAFGPCAGVELPACPPPCAEGAFAQCGESCDAETDAACGNEIGDGMTCVDDAWACTVHAPLGMGCNWVCRPE